MTWWTGIFGRKQTPSPSGLNYKVSLTLYSEDGTREAEILEFSNGETYLSESELDGGEFKDRHSGRMVGPFATPADAEKFITVTAWFRGGDE